jgi:hypothetical protein
VQSIDFASGAAEAVRGTLVSKIKIALVDDTR